MSTQALQPLIWLARRLTSSSVRSGTALFLVAAARACRAFITSGTIIAGCFIRACIKDLLHLSLLKPDTQVGICLLTLVWIRLSHRLGFLRHRRDRKSTRLNSSHLGISYAVFC